MNRLVTRYEPAKPSIFKFEEPYSFFRCYRGVTSTLGYSYGKCKRWFPAPQLSILHPFPPCIPPVVPQKRPAWRTKKWGCCDLGERSDSNVTWGPQHEKKMRTRIRIWMPALFISFSFLVVFICEVLRGIEFSRFQRLSDTFNIRCHNPSSSCLVVE